MKKLRNILITILMVFCSPLMIYAETDVSKVQIEKALKVGENEKYPALTFNYSVSGYAVAEGEEVNGYPAYTGVVPNDGFSVKTEFSAGLGQTGLKYNNDTKDLVGAKKTTTIDFSSVNYPRPGVYRYEVKEVQGNTQSVTYDSTVYILDVYVISENNQNKIATIQSKVSGSQDKQPIYFVNEYNTNYLEVKKTVNGNLGDKTKEFEFKLNIAANDCLEAGSSISGTLTKGSTTSDVEVTIGQDNSIYLADGDIFKVSSLPNGTVVKVNENATNYTITLKENGTEVTNTSVDKTINDNLQLEFINTLSGTTPNTGINTNLTPFIMMALLVAIYVGANIYIHRLKKEDDKR